MRFKEKIKCVKTLKKCVKCDEFINKKGVGIYCKSLEGWFEHSVYWNDEMSLCPDNIHPFCHYNIC